MDVLDQLQLWIDWLNQPLLETENMTITALGILKLIFIPVIVILLAGVLRRWLGKILQSKKLLDAGVRNAIVSISYYLFLIVGFAFALDSAGVNMTGLAVFSGGLGIGLGIGLQDVARNFISGLVLLIARPIRPGDRVQIGDLEGNVEKIGTYSTTVQTVRDATMIVPNSEILNNRLINWTHNEAKRMFFIPVGVHYDSDIDQVMELMRQAAADAPDVMDHPEPEVFLTDFGDSSINFEIAVWTTTQVFRPRRLISQYNVYVVKLFQKHGVVIPYPQRDVHLIPAKGAGLD